MDIAKIFTYLTNLSENNDREWYHAHKHENQEAMAVFEQIVTEFCLEISRIENTPVYDNPKKLIFRLARDTRFSADKSPYNAAFWAHISPYGKNPIPIGYYICIEPDNRSNIICGLHTAALTDATKMVRNYIVDHGIDLKNILSDKKFSGYFSLLGESLKNIPKGYDPELPQAEYLKNKSWYVEKYFTDKEVLDIELFYQKIIEACRIAKPFKDFLNQALADFKM